MRTVVIFSILLFVSTLGDAQNLYLNGSFEDPGTDGKPAYWDEDPWGDRLGVPIDIEYLTSGDAADGTAFVRVNPVSTSGGAHFGWASAEPNYQLEPNCRYLVTYSYRESDAWFRANPREYVYYSRSTGPGSAISIFLPIDHNSYPPPMGTPTDTWFEENLEITTGCKGAWEYWEDTITFSGYATSSLNGTEYVDYDNTSVEILVRYLTATVQITDSVPLTYDYSNTDLEIRYLSNSVVELHTVEKVEAPLPDTYTDYYGVPSLGKHWSIGEKSGEFSAILIFSYTDDELDEAGISENMLQIVRLDLAGGWTEIPSVIDFEANTISTRDPVTAFSDWGIVQGEYTATTGVDDWEGYW